MKKIPINIRLWGWVVIAVVICGPAVGAFCRNNFFHLHDFTHVARLTELETAVADGQFPPRWSRNLGYGYGLPQFSFYGPLFYLEAMLIDWVIHDPLWAIKISVIIQVGLIYIGVFLVSTKLWRTPKAGILSAALAVYAPYRAVDMYVRGAFGELTGIAMSVITLAAMIIYIRKPNLKNMGLIAIGTAGIFLSHNLIPLIWMPFLFLIGGSILIIERQFSWKRLMTVVTGFVLGLGLSAFYSLPAFMEKNLTQAEKLTSGFSDFNFHFLYLRQLWNSKWGYGGSIGGPNDNISFEVGKISLILIAIVSLSLLFWRRKLSRENKWLIIVCEILIITVFVFMTYKAKFLWDLIPLIKYIQFPWRFLSVTMILVPILAGALLLLIPKKFKWFAVIMIVSGQIGLEWPHQQPENYLVNNNDLYYTDAKLIQTQMSGIIPDFLPITAKIEQLPVTGVENEDRFSFDPLVKHTIEVNKSNQFLVSFENSPKSIFTMNIFDFPGWQLYLNGNKIDHQTNKNGLMEVSLPATTGQSYLSGKFEETPVRLIADTISLISVIGLLIILPINSKHEFIYRRN